MTIIELKEKGKKILKNNGFTDNNIIVNVLLCKVLNIDQQFLIVHQNECVVEDLCNIFLKHIDEIISGKPLQYITNRQEFMGLNFFVDENVLIPQPDTEILVEYCYRLCEKMQKNQKKICILDLCTGSGAIGISLDKLLAKHDNINVYASEINKDALNVAIKNNKILNANVEFIQSDMFDKIDDSIKFDMVISNPPYIETEVIKQLPLDVQSEPQIALDGGKDGLKFYRIIEKEAKKYLKDNGYICMEIGYNQARSVEQIFNKNYEIIEILKDYGKQDRCIVVKNRKN